MDKFRREKILKNKCIKKKLSKLENIKKSYAIRERNVVYKISPRRRESFAPHMYSMHVVSGARARQTKTIATQRRIDHLGER
jgi:hypothetical protein